MMVNGLVKFVDENELHGVEWEEGDRVRGCSWQRSAMTFKRKGAFN